MEVGGLEGPPEGGHRMEGIGCMCWVLVLVLGVRCRTVGHGV